MKSSIFVLFKKFLTCLTFVTMILLSNFVSASPANYNAQHIVIMEVNSAISPGAITYLESGFARLNKLDRPLAIIKLDTPGGLLSITHKIMKLITTAKAPVVIWITPEGALAGSAGAIISSSAHFLYMTPGTSIGAATPIIAHSGEDIQTDSKKKIVNSLVSQVKSLSKLRNRKSSGFEEMITKAKSFTAKESLKAGFIDGVTQNLEEVIAALNGKKFSLQGKEFTLQVNSSVKQINFNKGLGQKLIDILTHPSVSYFFLILGLLLLYWELLTPGGVVAGSIGSIFVLLAAISMYMIPINWGGLALIILATFLFVLELFITSYGILTIGGLTSLIVGSLYLYRTEEAYIQLQSHVIYITLGSLAFLSGLFGFVLYKAYKIKSPSMPFSSPEGQQGLVTTLMGDTQKDGYYQFEVVVKGEVWQAKCTSLLAIKDKVKVLSEDKVTLTLEVTKL